MDESALRMLVEMVKEASPVLWEASRQRNTAEIVMNAIGIGVSGGLMSVGIALIAKAREYTKDDKKGSDEKEAAYTVIVITAIVMAGLAFVIYGNVDALIYKLISPDFEAIENLMDLVG